ncbi:MULTISPECIES: CLCA_X family protein [Vibrio]|uniref:CLCA_X family protein n=1 Tax=Vibrio TaxID=662 RepID=UPI000EFA50A1|nr:CLCA_X family protein [Vibrio coralliirubri]
MKLTHFKYKTREGPDYRHGDQVSFMDIKQTFGMGSIRVGAWVTKEEKELAANLIFDSLADLAYILALPPEAIGLRGTLGLAFGSGGRKGVQAHYAPNQRELALAKNAGAGALAHEFWHAFDHYIAEKAFEIGDTSGPRKQILFASDCWLHDRKVRPHPLNESLMSLFDATLLSDNNLDKHDYVARSVIADKAMSARYFSLPTEMMARAFESVIESCSDIKNAYLVDGTTKPDMYPVYPDMAHRKEIYQALQGYFAPLGRSLSK